MLTSHQKRKLLQIADDVCRNILVIPIPEFFFQRCPQMKTTTTKAMAVLNDDAALKVFIDPNTELSPETIFVLCHELRHIYQFFKPELREEFDKQKDSSTISAVEYNLQPLEVDANAFGSICMSIYTGCEPLWEGLPKNVIIAIKKREEEIVNNEL